MSLTLICLFVKANGVVAPCALLSRFALFAFSLLELVSTRVPLLESSATGNSDLVVQHDPQTLECLPVNKQEILRIFEDFSNRKAARVIERLPAAGGFLDSIAVDRTMLAVHWPNAGPFSTQL